VPATSVEADTNEGPVVSTVELFVTEVAAREAASLPAASCTAVESLLTLGSVYATVTSWPDSIEHAASVNTTVEPKRLALVSEHDTPPTVTSNAPLGAIVPPNVSEYVNVISVPAVSVAAETNVGPVVSTVELFVTLVADNDEALFPFASFTAFEPAGCVYATDTDCPDSTAGEASVNTTVEPDTATPLTERDTPPTNTAKSEPAAVVVDNASEYVNVIVVPDVFVAAEEKVGAVVSTPKLKPETETSTGVLRSVVDPFPN
jgi:hypothetical protein